MGVKVHNFQIQGYLTLKDITAKTTWDVTLEIASHKLLGIARTNVYLSSFKMGPIRLAGFIETSYAERSNLSLSHFLIPYCKRPILLQSLKLR